LNEEQVVYIIRDFRDVAVSFFFHQHRIDERLVLIKSDIPFYDIRRIIWRHIIFPVEMHHIINGWGFSSSGSTILKCFYTIIRGAWIKKFFNGTLGRWDKHVEFWSNNLPPKQIVCYEQLLKNPIFTIQELLKTLNFNIPEKLIKQAIEEQSFDKKKKEFLKSGDKNRSQFMRKGIDGDWKNFLTKRMEKKIYILHGKMLKKYGYIL
jgi:hypothetical protein